MIRSLILGLGIVGTSASCQASPSENFHEGHRGNTSVLISSGLSSPIVDPVIDEYITPDQAACGVTAEDQVDVNGRQTIISPTRPGADETIRCLLERGHHHHVTSYITTLLTLGRVEQALYWNEVLARRVLGSRGLSSESPEDDLLRIEFDGDVREIARNFSRIHEYNSALLNQSFSDKWQQVYEYQEELLLEVSRKYRGTRL